MKCRINRLNSDIARIKWVAGANLALTFVNFVAIISGPSH